MPSAPSLSINEAHFGASANNFTAQTTPIAEETATMSEHYDFHFTGSGKEYFRIWIVNLCLTIATLGIYSAWAKVRRLQYFDRNTELAGAVFNFHGNPLTIFKGRLLALVLLIAYHFAFGFSKTFGIVVIGILFFSLPWLLRSALRFRLRNTSYRSLRFRFNGDVAGAYLSFSPLLALLLFPAVSIALFPNQAGVTGGVIFLLYLCWPIIHGQMKRYQHSHLQYGAHASSYKGTAFSLLKPYVFAMLWGIAAVVVILILASIVAGIGMALISNKSGSLWKAYFAGAVFVIVYLYSIYLIIGPYLQTRIWNKVWNATHFPGLDVQSELEFWPYLRLQTVNVILTLLSLGLFRPFAAVRAYRYRISRMSVSSIAFEQLMQHDTPEDVGAGGDGSADFLGIDISW